MGLKDQLRLVADTHKAEENAADAANARYFRPIAEEMARLGLTIAHTLGEQKFYAGTEIELNLTPFSDESAAVLNGSEEPTHKTPYVGAYLKVKGSTNIGSREMTFSARFQLSKDGAPIATRIEARTPDPRYSKCHGDHNLRVRYEYQQPHTTETLFPDLAEGLKLFLSEAEFQRLVENEEMLAASPLMEQAVQDVVDEACNRYYGVKISVPQLEEEDDSIAAIGTGTSAPVRIAPPTA